MYYRFDANLNLHSGYIKKEDNLDETLMFGEKVDESQLVIPWPFSLTTNDHLPLRLSDYYPGPKLMTVRLVETLRSFGVDNLQTFPATIIDKRTRRTIDNYLVVNVVGLVAVADLDASKTRPLADVHFFESLTIDTGKALNLLMFRLAESRVDIIVAEKIARRIEEGGFVDVTVELLAERSNTNEPNL